MTREQAAKLAPIITAYAEGKSVELFDLHTNKWVNCIDPIFYSVNTYRIKPENKYRPWTFEEAPLNVLFVGKDRLKELRFIFVGVSQNGYRNCLDCCFDFKFLLDNYLHSSDNGKTWLPCGILI